MIITPLPWSWKTPLGAGWLDQHPPEVPVVWLAGLTDEQDHAGQVELISCLSPTERQRLDRLRVREDQQRFLLGRGLLRVLAGAQLNLPPERVELSHGPFGKPCWVSRDAAPLHFNVSHSGQWVLLAFDRTQEVGVDVERVRPGQDWGSVARRVFPDDLYRAWAAMKPEERPAAFFRAWTRHEAGLKALGLGFAGADSTAQESRLVHFDLALPEGYQGAVASVR